MAVQSFRPLIAGLAGLALPCAEAVPVNLDGWQGQFESRLTYLTAWALQDPDNAWVGAANGGRASGQWHDDGRLAYASGDTVRRRFEGEHALELHDERQGVFLRARYWHDQALRDPEQRPWPQAAQASGGEWLDAFYHREYAVAERAGLIRLGRQRVNWTAARWLDVDPLNPQDRTGLPDPFVPLAERARPSGMLFVSQALSERWALEGFHAWDWQPDLMPGCADFVSSSDLLPGRCAGFDVGVPPPAAAMLHSIAADAGHGYAWGAQGLRLPRQGVQRPSGAGQFGLALRWQAAASEYRLQFSNTHSRQAFVTVREASAGTWAALPSILQASASQLEPAQAAPALEWQRAAVLLGDAGYRLSYPDDVRRWSASASGRIGSRLGWSGELSYRPNAPVQRGLGVQLGETLAGQDGEQGYQRHGITRLVLSLRGDTGALAGASDSGWTLEAGHAHTSSARGAVAGLQGREAPVSAHAWGYRVLAEAEYRDLWPRLDLLPRLGFAHDVRGVDADGLLSEGARTATFGVGLRYLRSYRLQIDYTLHQGGRYNRHVDRDYVSAALSVAF